ncbi:hypothetical protein H0H92_006280 [Tricholoma furcatifolium]|nr:hypothetical protein H0H92_006280 [Tricholoma furcatifolium]
MSDACVLTPNVPDFTGLRIASVFIILFGSTCGALFPVLAKRSTWLHVPKGVFKYASSSLVPEPLTNATFSFAKYFGSGVIIATAFIHLLSPALDELGSPCLGPEWAIYPYALALSLLSIFSIFIVELIAFRWGTAKLAKLGITHDPHGHDLGSHAAHGPEPAASTTTPALSTQEKTSGNGSGNGSDIESQDHDHEVETSTLTDSAAAQIIGVAILEFGVTLHSSKSEADVRLSVLIGLTLAVDINFKVLFVVIVFHQIFEGLGIGSRLAYMRLPPKYSWVPIAGALLYGITTPVGIAAGLGVRSTYNPNSTKALIVSGVLDSLSSGILIYTGLVELLAHEFLFNKSMIEGSNKKLAYALCCMLLGCGIMALLGRWA